MWAAKEYEEPKRREPNVDFSTNSSGLSKADQSTVNTLTGCTVAPFGCGCLIICLVFGWFVYHVIMAIGNADWSSLQ